MDDAAENIAAEVIDLRSLRPMDTETVIASVRKTNRCVTVEMSPRAWRPPSKSVWRRMVFQLVSGSTWERPSLPPAS